MVNWKVTRRCTAVFLVALVTALSCIGYQLFGREHQDTLRRADAILVLGGEHDGREEYGLDLAREGYASTVLVSDPYRPYGSVDQQIMPKVCNAGTPRIEVICFVPNPSTTRGEAMFVQQIARARHWKSVIVVSWRFHLVRARYIFGQCFDGNVIMRSVPRSYAQPLWLTAYTYSYQYGGLAKAALLGCDR
ncbi:YdcF family protein [Gordonia sp. NPDC003422]